MKRGTILLARALYARFRTRNDTKIYVFVAGVQVAPREPPNAPVGFQVTRFQPVAVQPVVAHLMFHADLVALVPVGLTSLLGPESHPQYVARARAQQLTAPAN